MSCFSATFSVPLDNLDDLRGVTDDVIVEETTNSHAAVDAYDVLAVSVICLEASGEVGSDLITSRKPKLDGDSGEVGCSDFSSIDGDGDRRFLPAI